MTRNRKDRNFAIDWRVKGGDVAACGDMGYTYGLGQITLSAADGNTVTHENPYLVVWQKGTDGKWRSM